MSQTAAKQTFGKCREGHLLTSNTLPFSRPIGAWVKGCPRVYLDGLAESTGAKRIWFGMPGRVRFIVLLWSGWTVASVYRKQL